MAFSLPCARGASSLCHCGHWCLLTSPLLGPAHPPREEPGVELSEQRCPLASPAGDEACEATRAVAPGSSGGSKGALCCCVCSSQRRHQRMSCPRLCASAAGSLLLSGSGLLKRLPRAPRLWCECARCHPQSRLLRRVACEPPSLLHCEMPGHFTAAAETAGSLCSGRLSSV